MDLSSVGQGADRGGQNPHGHGSGLHTNGGYYLRDLIELRSETAVARASPQRLEGSTYEVQDGDIVAIRFNK